MEFNLILLVVGFLVLVWLIFKFIKKLVFAILAVFLLVILIFGGTIGLVYLDLNNLAAQEDFEINLVLKEGENYILGTSFDVKNQEFDVSSVNTLTESDLNDLNVKEISDEDNLFIVELDKEFFEEIMVEEYTFEGIQGYEDYDLSLTKNEVLELIDESSSSEELVDILLEKNEVDGILADIAKPTLVSEIDSYINNSGVQFQEAIFLMALSQSVSDKSNALDLVQGFKDDEISIYPDRFTFGLVRMLPAETLQENLPDFSE